MLGVSLAFGLTVLTMVHAIGHISGCHLNPAVSFGLWAGGRFPAGELAPYIVAQLVGAILGAIGLALTLMHLIGIPLTNLLVNPARSTDPALFVGGWAIAQLWLFWVAPIIGAVVAGFGYKALAAEGE